MDDSTLLILYPYRLKTFENLLLLFSIKLEFCNSFASAFIHIYIDALCSGRVWIGTLTHHSIHRFLIIDIFITWNMIEEISMQRNWVDVTKIWMIAYEFTFCFVKLLYRNYIEMLPFKIQHLVKSMKTHFKR